MSRLPSQHRGHKKTTGEPGGSVLCSQEMVMCAMHGRLHRERQSTQDEGARSPMGRCIVGVIMLLTLGILGVPFAAEAQPPAKIPRVGILALGTPPFYGLDEVQQGLRDLGYVEG